MKRISRLKFLQIAETFIPGFLTEFNESFCIFKENKNLHP